MNRVRDYSQFAIGYFGLGYLMLWPLSSPDGGSELFGAWLMCGERWFAPVDWLCGLPHPLRLSLPLHALGLASALFVAGFFFLRALGPSRRKRSPRAAIGGSVPGARLPAIVRMPRRNASAGPLRRVKPRSHFGLRGMPH